MLTCICRRYIHRIKPKRHSSTRFSSNSIKTIQIICIIIGESRTSYNTLGIGNITTTNTFDLQFETFSGHRSVRPKSDSDVRSGWSDYFSLFWSWTYPGKTKLFFMKVRMISLNVSFLTYGFDSMDPFGHKFHRISEYSHMNIFGLIPKPNP